MFSLVIQGPPHINSIRGAEEFRNNSNIKNIILSTWEPINEEQEKVLEEVLPRDDLFDDVLIEKHPDLTNIYNFQNRFLQCYSTLNGLKEFNTEFSIKIRSDEYYSNTKVITNKIKNNKNKFVCGDFYLGKPEFEPFHISDHLIGMRTDIFKHTMRQCLLDCVTFDVPPITDITLKNKMMRYINNRNYGVEQHIFTNYMKIIGKKIYSNENIKIDVKDIYKIMCENVETISSYYLKPFDVCIQRKHFINDFSFFKPENYLGGYKNGNVIKEIITNDKYNSSNTRTTDRENNTSSRNCSPD